MNERIPSSPPSIEPVKDILNRPVWSVLVPTYNCGRFLKQTLESILAQDPGPQKMQIEVIDDASTDIDVEKLVAETGKGRVSFFRQPQNTGSLRNFETCINRARGKWVHILHGDDYIEPGFYNEIESLFHRFPEAGAAFTGFTQVDEDGNFLLPNDPVLDKPGILKNWLYTIAQGQKIQPPAIVVKRSVYENLGGFFAVHYGEDWEMWVRIAAHYPVAHSPAKFAKYRVHNNNISSRYFLSGQNIKDIATVIDIIQKYLPPIHRKRLKNIAGRNWSYYFARTADLTYGRLKNPSQALVQAKMAFRLHKNAVSVFYCVKTWVKILLRKG